MFATLSLLAHGWPALPYTVQPSLLTISNRHLEACKRLQWYGGGCSVRTTASITMYQVWLIRPVSPRIALQSIIECIRVLVHTSILEVYFPCIAYRVPLGYQLYSTSHHFCCGSYLARKVFHRPISTLKSCLHLAWLGFAHHSGLTIIRCYLYIFPVSMSRVLRPVFTF